MILNPLKSFQCVKMAQLQKNCHRGNSDAVGEMKTLSYRLDKEDSISWVTVLKYRWQCCTFSATGGCQKGNLYETRNLTLSLCHSLSDWSTLRLFLKVSGGRKQCTKDLLPLLFSQSFLWRFPIAICLRAVITALCAFRLARRD